MDGCLDWPVVAGRVRSPTAGSEQFSSKNRGLAERLLSGNRDGRFGHDPAVALRAKLPFGEARPLADTLEESQGRPNVTCEDNYFHLTFGVN
jgi:hypothetical protein